MITQFYLIKSDYSARVYYNFMVDHKKLNHTKKRKKEK